MKLWLGRWNDHHKKGSYSPKYKIPETLAYYLMRLFRWHISNAAKYHTKFISGDNDSARPSLLDKIGAFFTDPQMTPDIMDSFFVDGTDYLIREKTNEMFKYQSLVRIPHFESKYVHVIVEALGKFADLKIIKGKRTTRGIQGAFHKMDKAGITDKDGKPKIEPTNQHMMIRYLQNLGAPLASKKYSTAHDIFTLYADLLKVQQEFIKSTLNQEEKTINKKQIRAKMILPI